MIFDLMFFASLFRKPKQCYWRNKDHDIPVTFVKVAGEVSGAKFAEVQYDGKTSYVPLDEIVYERVYDV